MARRRNTEVETDTLDTEEQTMMGDHGADETGESRGKGRKSVPRSRITLSLTTDTVRRLRNAANYEGMSPCDLVEAVLGPVVRPYVVSLRGKRFERPSGEAA